MQTADLGNGNHLAGGRGLNRTRVRRVPAERPMSARVVTIVQERADQAPKLYRVNDNDVIQTFAAQRADETLHVRGLPRRTRRDDDFLNAQAMQTAADFLSVG